MFTYLHLSIRLTMTNHIVTGDSENEISFSYNIYVLLSILPLKFP